MITVTRADLPPIKKYTEYLERIWISRWLTNNGEFVQLLEKKLEEYTAAENLLVVSNGTVALELALRVLKLKGEVITTAFTFAATTNVILWSGLTPVFADIDPDTFNIDPNDIEKKITGKTSAILAVHVYGNPCYVHELQRIADQYNLKLIFDAAHAFGVQYKGRSVPSFGDISTLSFHATKVFNTGEGGAVILKDKGLFEELKLMRNHGIRSEEEIELVGTNAKMSELHAAMGLCNLENIDEKIQKRKKLYLCYKNELWRSNVKFQKIIASKYNYSYMPVCLQDSEKRDRVYSELIKQGIWPRKYFFPLTVNYGYFRADRVNLIEKYNLRHAADIAGRVLCLPLYPDLEMTMVDKIVGIVKDLAR